MAHGTLAILSVVVAVLGACVESLQPLLWTIAFGVS